MSSRRENRPLASFIAFFEETGLDDVRQVGGKGANLGHLTRAGQRVPPGFAVKAAAFDLFLSGNDLKERIEEVISGIDPGDLGMMDRGMADVRELMESAPVPQKVEEELRDAYKRLVEGDRTGGLVAVRSSVGTRDLSASSFPGQMDTYHNVKGADEVVRLVRKCWASTFSYSAAVSRNARGIGHFDVFIAPLVQLMVPADSAGVVFTANPVTNRRDQMVINACFGLGEGVVSGEVNADHYVIDHDSLEVLEKEITDKRVKFVLDSGKGSGTVKVELKEEDGGRPCLTGEQVARLARMAREVEESYECPQDIEWAYHDGDLYVLQSRRITTLADEPGEAPDVGEGWDSEFDTRVDTCYPYYTLSNISEVLPGVLTPLTMSGIDSLDYGFVKTNTNFGLMKGITPESEYTFLGVFYNRAHLNLSVVKTLTAKLPGASAQEFERMLPEDDEGWEEGEFRLTPRSLLGMLPPMVLIPYWMIRTPRDVAAMRPVMEKRIADARKLDMERIPYELYLEWMEGSRDYRYRVITHHITVSQFSVVYYDLLRELTEKWLDDGQGSIASRLVTGLQNIESAQPSMEIWDLSREVLGSDELTGVFEGNEPGEIEEVLRSGTSDDERAFVRSLDAFLSRFGYRSVFEAELMLPNWEEDPSYVFAMIKNYMETKHELGPRELALKQERVREETYRDVMGTLRWHQRLLLKLVLRQTHKFVAMREYTKATLIMGVAQTKKEYRALGRRLAAEGLLERPDDLYFLKTDEVKTLAGGEDPDVPVPELVARRRREYEQNKTVVLPEYSRGKPKPLTGEDLRVKGGIEVLKGIPVSPGRVTGPARVITDPRRNSKIMPGEILVAPVTDAAWTPLFVTAGAIVVDVGGPLSHGSIVAREYGIPGVLNVGVGTRLIETGQRITVDGDRGEVIIHADEPIGEGGGSA